MDQKFNPLGRRRLGDTETTPMPTTTEPLTEARPENASIQIAGQSPQYRLDDNASHAFPSQRPQEVSQRNAAIQVKNVPGVPLPENEQPFTVDEPVADSPDLQSMGTLLGGLQTSWFRTLGWLGWCVLVLIGASFLLVTLSQTAVLVREINSWIFPARVAGWGALGAIWLAVAIASFQLARIFVRYRQSPGVSLSALEKIREREENRAVAAQSVKAAAEKVRQFLVEYPTDEAQCVFLKSVMGPSTQEILLGEREQLLSEHHGVSSQWLDSVRKRYTYRLDEAARGIVFRHSVAIGMGTAVSPRGAVDSVIVLVGMQRMTIDLCRLYGVRPGRLESLIILGHVLVAATVAAGGDEASDAVADQIQETLTSSIGALGASIAGKLGGKATEGTVNAMFARRIGGRLRRYLSPISD